MNSISIGRRSFLLASGIAAGSALLAGCGRGSDAPSTSSAPPIDDKPASGRVTLWAPDGDATVLAKVLAGFKAANPSLKLDITLVPAADYNTKLQTAISSGTAPDIAQVYTEAQTQFLASGAFAPVPSGLVDPADFFKGVWDAGSYRGTTYSVPWYAYTYALIYRKDLAQAGGATAPTKWDQSIGFWKALEKGGAVKGFAADVGWDTYTGQTLERYALQAGQSLLSSDGTKWQIDTPTIINAIDYFAAPFLQGLSAVDTPQFLDAQPYFIQGKTGSMISGPWVVASLDSTAKHNGWTAAHVSTAVAPAGPAGNTGNLGGGSWVVSKNSTNANSAWKVVRAMANAATQIAQFKAYGSMPAVQSAWKDTAISANPLYDPFFTQLRNVKGMPPVPTWNELSTAIGKELEAVARGKESSTDAAKNLQSQADSLGVGK